MQKYYLSPAQERANAMSFNERAPVVTEMSSMERQMKALLENKSIPDEAKLPLYYSLLSGFNFQREQLNQPIKVKVVSPPAPPTATPSAVAEQAKTVKLGKYSEEEIIADLPATKQAVGQRLLKYILENPDIAINKNGELVIEGLRVKRSNIYSLVNQVSRDIQNVDTPGVDKLFEVLKAHNAPIEIIGNKTLANLWKDTVRSPLSDGFATPGSGHSTPGSVKRKKQRTQWEVPRN